jgi:tryptophan synthase alpha chain
MKKLVAYITSTYPEKNFSVDLALALAENGVDSLELGVPFSDPVADGPVIEKANHRALKNGFRFSDLLDISQIIAPKIDTLWMGYFNIFYQYGLERLLQKANELGISGMIIPDVPHEEALLYDSMFKTNGISNITFVAPTDSKERIKFIASDASKFIYLVAYAGITGAGKSEDLQQIITNIKEVSTTPVFVGFGVNEQSAKEKIKGADGVIVGSALVDILLQERLTYDQMIKKCCEISRNIKDKINE